MKIKQKNTEFLFGGGGGEFEQNLQNAQILLKFGMKTRSRLENTNELHFFEKYNFPPPERASKCGEVGFWCMFKVTLQTN